MRPATDLSVQTLAEYERARREPRPCSSGGAPRILNGVSRPRLQPAFLLALCLCVVGWLAPARADERAAEKLLIEQPLRISTAVAAISRPEGEAPAMFFMGFAGFGEERVFANEVRFAAKVVAERYGTGARSLLLVNDRQDSSSAPIATVSSLHYALAALANRMDVDEDVLFLALSSHGSAGTLAVSHEPLMLRDLTADGLAQALDDAGIKWRVIVISACYSGSFIDALRNANTIVITAAAADRSSFGCSDDRDLTYFGEAFYRDALPGSGTLREAFGEAVTAIEEREAREHIEPSRPQAYFGEAIEARLARIRRPAAP
jgi:hypothetical protein